MATNRMWCVCLAMVVWSAAIAGAGEVVTILGFEKDELSKLRDKGKDISQDDWAIVLGPRVSFAWQRHILARRGDATEGERAFAFDIPEKVWAYLDAQAGQYTGTVVGANLPYDLDWLASEGVHFTAAEWFKDVQVAEWRSHP